MITNIELKTILDAKYNQYCTKDFIKDDPISIPYMFSKKNDIEIVGFFASLFAWGKRKIIIDKSNILLDMMNGDPYNFVLNYSFIDSLKIKNFKHRTFNDVDLEFFMKFFQTHLNKNSSLESLFYFESEIEEENIKTYLHNYFLNTQNTSFLGQRTKKHISTPFNKSACKRLCMYLRWMVRKDVVDFGIWQKIKPKQLVIPLDVHVLNISQKLGIIDSNVKPSWDSAIKITNYLKTFDSQDPVKYDFSIFSMGINKEFK